MNLLTVLQNSLLEGYATRVITTETIFVCLGFTAVLALYICIVYRLANKNSFYNRSFHLSLFALALITSAVILTIQSNVVVSLGMVGALSIVRFRTAIKEPMDLVFLFWSIAAGIICGAGFALIAIVCSLALTVGIIIFSVFPAHKETLILVVNSNVFNEAEILNTVGEACLSYKVRARSVNLGNLNLAVEVRARNPQALLAAVNEIDSVTSVSLVEHTGDVTV